MDRIRWPMIGLVLGREYISKPTLSMSTTTLWVEMPWCMQSPAIGLLANGQHKQPRARMTSTCPARGRSRASSVRASWDYQLWWRERHGITNYGVCCGHHRWRARPFSTVCACGCLMCPLGVEATDVLFAGMFTIVDYVKERIAVVHCTCLRAR